MGMGGEEEGGGAGFCSVKAACSPNMQDRSVRIARLHVLGMLKNNIQKARSDMLAGVSTAVGEAAMAVLRIAVAGPKSPRKILKRFLIDAAEALQRSEHGELKAKVRLSI